MNGNNLARRTPLRSAGNTQPRSERVIDLNSGTEGSLVDDRTINAEIIDAHRYGVSRRTGNVAEGEPEPRRSTTGLMRTERR